MIDLDEFRSLVLKPLPDAKPWDPAKECLRAFDTSVGGCLVLLAAAALHTAIRGFPERLDFVAPEDEYRRPHSTIEFTDGKWSTTRHDWPLPGRNGGEVYQTFLDAVASALYAPLTPSIAQVVAGIVVDQIKSGAAFAAKLPKHVLYATFGYPATIAATFGATASDLTPLLRKDPHKFDEDHAADYAEFGPHPLIRAAGIGGAEVSAYLRRNSVSARTAFDAAAAACRLGKPSSLLVLLDHGHALATQQFDGRYLLWEALSKYDLGSRENRAIVRILIQAGADPDRRDADGFDAWDLVGDMGMREALTWHGRLRAVAPGNGDCQLTQALRPSGSRD